MTVRRRRLPAELREPFASFTRVAGILERAKLAIVEVVPTTRLPGVPLAEAVLEFETLLRQARAAMPSWRRPQTEDVWVSADAAIAEALDRARSLREEGPDPSGFEGLIWAADHLLAPLEAFEAGAERFQALRKGRDSAAKVDPGDAAETHRL